MFNGLLTLRLELDASEEHARRREEERMAAAARVYTTFDRILTGREITVTVRDEPDLAPGWTDGKNITLNTGAKLLELADIGALSGLNLHEVGHILHTPRKRTELGRAVEDRGLGFAFNQLEDQRVETLLVAEYPSAANMLRMAVGRFLLQEADEDMVYPLLSGRWYLSPGLRRTFRDAYACPQDLTEIDTVAAEYRAVSTSNWREALALIERWDRLSSLSRASCHSRALSEGTAETRLVQQALYRGSLESYPADGLDSASPSPSAAATEVAEALSDPRTLAELKDMQRRIVGGSDYAPVARAGDYATSAPTSKYLVASRRFATELRGAVAAGEPGWRLRESSGRVNLQRVMSGAPADELFDRWDEGGDGLDLEVVLLIDRSGTMNGDPVKDASAAGWAILRALRSQGFGATLFAFDHVLEQVWGPSDPVGPMVKELTARGGTAPTSGLEEAAAILHASCRTSKLVIILTDGLWQTAEEDELRIARLQSSGVVVAVAYLRNQWTPGDGDGHGADVFTALDTAGDLVPFAKRIVLQLVQRSTANL